MCVESDMIVDPWAAHISSFEIKDAQITGIEQGGNVLVRHDLHLRVTEGRFEHLAEDDRGKPAPSNLRYGCHIDVVGAPAQDYWSGTDMQLVIIGAHENGARITIAGLGAIGFDDDGSPRIEFENAPEMVVDLKEDNASGSEPK